MKIKQIISFTVFCVMLSGCTLLKTGDFVAQSHFIHPGSTVHILGEVNEEIYDWGFIFPPIFDYAAAITLYENSLNQQPGADMLIDYTIDTTYTHYLLLLVTMEVHLHGKAADVKIGGDY